MPPHRSSSTAANDTAAANGLVLRRALVTLAGILLYVFAFYSSDHRRRLILSLLLVPDELVKLWVGEDWSRFGVFDHLPVFAGATFMLIVGGVTGWLLLHRLQVETRFDRLERFVIAIASGLSIWSLLTLVIGLGGRLQARWLFAVLTVLIVAAAAIRFRFSRQIVSSTDSDVAPKSNFPLTWFGKCGLALCVPLTILILLGGCLPSAHFDVREYHLQVPKEWFQQGQITFLPHNVYGNMPLGAELHAILGMLLCSGRDDWWWGALIGKTIIAAFGPLAAIGVFVIGRRFVSSDAGAWGAFAYLSTPWIGHVSMTGLIDGVVACYVVLAVLVALVGWATMRTASNQAESSDWRIMALSGFLAGSAVACKYPVLVFLAAPLGLLVTFLPRFQIHWKSSIAFALAMVVACGLWFGKNWVLAGNPTYPLLYGLFGGESWNAEKDARWTRAHGPPRDAHGNRYSPAQARESLQLLAIKSDHQSPWLVPLALAAAWVWPHKKSRWLLVLMLALVTSAVLTWWLLTHRVDRFLVPVIPLVAVAAGLGATWCEDVNWRRAVVAIAILCCASTFLHLGSGFAADNRILVSLADLRKDVINHGHRWLNEHVQPGNRVLLVGEAQVFDFEVPILYNTCFDDCVFDSLFRGRSREERQRILREERISHIFVSWYELRRYREPGNYGYSDYPTEKLFHEELVDQQGLLRSVPIPVDDSVVDPSVLEVFEVVQ